MKTSRSPPRMALPAPAAGVAWTLQNSQRRKAANKRAAKQEGSAMGFLIEVDVDEFLELMECETEARLRVAEIMERRRRSKAAASSERSRNEEPTSH
jgi:hypothetical protein